MSVRSKVQFEEPNGGCAPSPGTPCTLVSGPKRTRAFWAPRCHFDPSAPSSAPGAADLGWNMPLSQRRPWPVFPSLWSPCCTCLLALGAAAAGLGYGRALSQASIRALVSLLGCCPLVYFDQQLLESGESQRDLWEGTMVSRAQHCPRRDTWRHSRLQCLRMFPAAAAS